MEQKIVKAIKTVALRDKRIKDEYIRQFNITTEQALCMKFLSKNEQVIQKDIQQYTNTRKSSVTSLLNNLETKGLITRIIDNEDKRKKYVILTEDGKNVLKNIDQNMPSLKLTINKNLTKEEKKELLCLLNKLTK